MRSVFAAAYQTPDIKGYRYIPDSPYQTGLVGAVAAGTGTTWTEVCRVPADSIVSGDWLVFIRADVGCITKTELVELRYKVNATAYPSTVVRVEPAGSATPSTQYKHISIMRRHTLNGTDPITIEMRGVSATDDWRAANVGIAAWRLSDLQEGTEYWYAEDTTLTALTASYQDFAEVNFNQGASQYFHGYGCFGFRVDDTSYNTRFLIRAGTGEHDPVTELRGQDTTEEIYKVWGIPPPYTQASGTPTLNSRKQISARNQNASGLNDHVFSSICFFNAGVWNSYDRWPVTWNQSYNTDYSPTSAYVWEANTGGTGYYTDPPWERHFFTGTGHADTFASVDEGWNTAIIYKGGTARIHQWEHAFGWPHHWVDTPPSFNPVMIYPNHSSESHTKFMFEQSMVKGSSGGWTDAALYVITDNRAAHFGWVNYLTHMVMDDGQPGATFNR